MSKVDKNLFKSLNFVHQYEWTLKCDGTPNMTSCKNKENLIDILTRLNNQYNKKISSKYRTKLNNNPTDVGDCPICMEPITDNMANLKCDHSLCIDCFASHSRVNNTCPLCRDVFASKVKIQEHMLDETLECIAENYLSDYYINSCLDLMNQIDINDADKSLEYRNNQKFRQLKSILMSVCIFFMKTVVDWYKSG